MVEASNTPYVEPWLGEYRSLTEDVGLVDLSDRSRVEISGEDRLSFLHNLSTNEIRKLPPGAGCEAFLCNVQGKTLAHVLVFSGPRSLVLNAVAGQAERIVQHLDHYLIRERVELHDRTLEWGELFVAGPRAEALLAPLVDGELPQGMLETRKLMVNSPNCHPGFVTWIRRVPLIASVGFLLDCHMENDFEDLSAALLDSGASAVGKHAFDAARIENGTPSFGQDISDKNLPQEIGREGQTISFTKGCYLGQETVARIDALGHVNRRLCGLQFSGSTVPQPGLQLTAGEQPIAEVTSATWSPRLAAPLALGYVRRGHETPGTELQSALGPARVVKLPLD